MRRKIIMKTLLPLTVIALVAIIGFKFTQSVSAGFSGAIFTTLSDGGTVNQNLYESKDLVYLNGGPQGQNGPKLPNGTYYFQVTTPNGGLLSTDPARCRQLTVANGVISGAAGACPHSNGTFNPANFTTPVKLMPFDNTTNAGGEYKVWLIRQATTTVIVGDPLTSPLLSFSNSNAKTDNFKVRETLCDPNSDPTCAPPPTVTLSGHKFYDANANALDDDGQVVAGVQIVISITRPDTSVFAAVVTTDAAGNWTYPTANPNDLPVPSGSSYVVSENLPCVDSNNDSICDVGSYWVQTAPLPDGMGFQGYTGIANANVTGLNFGDVCFYPGSGGLTLGYWSNKNGNKVMTNGGPYGINAATYPVIAIPPDGMGMGKDLMFLQRLNLKESSTSRRFPNGADYDPANYDEFRNWLLSGNAVNMSYMLSVQLSATSLDVRHKFLSDSQLVDARNVCNSIGDCFGFVTIGEIRVLANQSLNNNSLTVSGSPWRDSQEQMKNFLDDVNNNRLAFASSSPCSVFYPVPTAPLSDKTEQ
jgi:hypothetical protein